MKFGKPIRCDRDGATCGVCKKPIDIGQILHIQFPQRIPWCSECAADAPQDDQHGSNLKPICEQLTRIADALTGQTVLLSDFSRRLADLESKV